MKVVTKVEELRSVRAVQPEPFGLVPTMGFLHEGHLSLVRCARKECASVGVSIFVNPAQFDPTEDLASYPRDLERDLDLLQQEDTDVVWTPTVDVMYPEEYQTWVRVEKLTQPLEGLHRPRHFNGVTTVVAKLFNAFQPDRAYFGQKDAQQAIVIRRMVDDLNFALEVVVCPTVREDDGLAMSSRNSYLIPDQRSAATVLYRALRTAKEAFEMGERDAEALRKKVSEILARESLAKPQYVSVAHPETLTELNGKVERALLSMAVYIGETRLIDNILLGESHPPGS